MEIFFFFSLFLIYVKNVYFTVIEIFIKNIQRIFWFL